MVPQVNLFLYERLLEANGRPVSTSLSYLRRAAKEKITKEMFAGQRLITFSSAKPLERKKKKELG